ncbi:hypothetical protein Tco_0474421, partial [Tanacetum coccineum]
EIAKPITPPSESASKEDSDPEQAQRDTDMQKNLALIAKYKNDNQTGQFGKQRTVTVVGARETVECMKPKRVKDYTYQKEKMLLCKQAEKGVSLQAEQADWLEDTNEEIDKQELEAHYSYMVKIQEVPTTDSGIDTEPLKSTRDSSLIALQNKQTELETYKTLNDRIVDYDKLDVKEGLVKEKTKIPYDQSDPANRLIPDREETLTLEKKNDSFTFVHELKQEMHADLKYVESLENEIHELESNKAEFSNMYDTLLQECVSNDVMCSYLHSLSDLDALNELQCLYLHKVKECECLAQKLLKQIKFVSKEVYTELLRSFAKLEIHSISLELDLQQCQEQMKNDTVFKEKGSNVFQKEHEQYHEIQDLKAQLQDKNISICELKKLIEKCKGKSVETKFDKPFVVRQPNAQRILKPSILGKSAPFLDSLERKSFS